MGGLGGMEALLGRGRGMGGGGMPPGMRMPGMGGGGMGMGGPGGLEAMMGRGGGGGMPPGMRMPGMGGGGAGGNVTQYQCTVLNLLSFIFALQIFKLICFIFSPNGQRPV